MSITLHVREPHSPVWQSVAARPGQSLMRAVKDRGLDIEASCEGCLACGTCLVHIDEAWLDRLPAPAADEEGLLEWLESRQSNSRLACQIRASDDLDGIRLVIAG